MDIFGNNKMVCEVLKSQNILICHFLFSQLVKNQQSNIVLLQCSRNINIFLKENRIGFTQL